MSASSLNTVAAGARAASLFRRSRKGQPATELLCDHIYRPLAHLVVLVCVPLRVPPLAVLLAGTGTGLGAAVGLARGHLVVAALLLQLKTVLDNADGQLARATGRVSITGRYLDSESDLLVDAAVFGALGYWSGRPLLAAATFALLTLVVSANFNLKHLYSRERGGSDEIARARASLLERIYALLYGWQDRLAELVVERRLRGLSRDARIAYHDAATLRVVANFGLTTQLAALGLCLALGRPNAYLAFASACAVTVATLWIRRDLRVKKIPTTNTEEVHWIAEP